MTNIFISHRLRVLGSVSPVITEAADVLDAVKDIIAIPVDEWTPTHYAIERALSQEAGR